MSKGFFIIDQEYTFKEFAHHFARALSSITKQDEEGIFSMPDIQYLLRCVNEYVPGEFEICRTDSHYYQIVYKSEVEVIENFKEKWENFIT